MMIPENEPVTPFEAYLGQFGLDLAFRAGAERVAARRERERELGHRYRLSHRWTVEPIPQAERRERQRLGLGPVSTYWRSRVVLVVEPALPEGGAS